MKEIGNCIPNKKIIASLCQDKLKAKHAKRQSNALMPFMIKDLSKNIMKRSQLRNKYFQSNTEDNRKLYTKQRNYCFLL